MVIKYKRPGDPDFIDVTSAHPKVLKLVEALVGGPIKVANFCRNGHFSVQFYVYKSRQFDPSLFCVYF